ncbi:MAG: SusC/RagA family TonB-linked outer membrane protein [Candidatus Kapaibacterium sp.]
MVLLAVAMASTAMAQTGLVGKVSDASTKKPLRGVSVRVDKTTLGGVTKADGSFSVKLLQGGNYTLSITYMGYKKAQKSVTVQSDQTATVNIELDPDRMLLEEVVVVGYGTKQKREVTGAYTTVKGDEVVNTPNPTMEASLQGRVSGVQITQANGMAGTAASVRVRGVGSITANTEPLYVIDGVPMTTGDFSARDAVASNTNALSFLNPNDIESIDILKDAAATAIYGSRGANGVVLITTKRGKDGSMQVSAGHYSGFLNEANRLQLVDRDTWINMYYEARKNDVTDSLMKLSRFSGQDWNTVSAFIASNDTMTNLINNAKLPQGFTRQTAANTNWFDQVLRTGSTSESYLSLNGGTNAVRYFFNTTYRDEQGFIVGNDYNRFSNRLSVDAKPTSWFDMGGSISLTRERNNRVNSAWSGGLGAAQSKTLPIYPIYDSTGAYWRPGSGLNPLAELENRRFIATTWRTVANGYSQLNLMDGLYVRGTAGFDIYDLTEDRYNPPVLTATPTAELRNVRVFNWTTNAFVNYSALTGDVHDLNMTAGMEVQRSDRQDVGTTGERFPNTYFETPQNAAIRNGYTFRTASGFLSYFGRVNYKFLNRYLFTATIRSDASSRFGDNQRWGTFPSASAAWIFSNEDFMKDNGILTFGKIRASYGISGNAAIGDFTWQGTYSAGSDYNGQPGTRPSQLPNADLTWETSQQTDIALDFGLLNDRITGSVNYYHRLSKDMLLNERVPASSGLQTVIRNVGEMSNSGWEFNVRSVNVSSPEFEWTTDFNITMNTNKIISLGSITSPDAIDLGFGETRVVPGYPFATYMLVRYSGADAKTGLPVYMRPVMRNFNENGRDTMVAMNGLRGRPLELEEARDTSGNPLAWNANWRVPTGKNYPDAFGGITNTFRYAGFDVSVLFTYQIGNSIYDDAGKRLVGNISQDGGWNQMTITEERWQNPGDQTNVARLTLKGARDINTDQHLYSADFLRLRNLTIGYTLPTATSNSLGLNRLRVYMTAQNILTFTNFPGWDPEVVRDHTTDQQRNGNQGVTYLTPPQARSFIFGVNVEL